MNYVPESEIMADCLFTIYLLWVSCQDAKEMQVVRYSHLPGLFAVFWKLWLFEMPGVEGWFEFFLRVFTLFVIQFVSYRFRLYGLADAIVFFLGGMFLVTKTGLYDFLMFNFMFQAIAGILLLAVQIVKRNVRGTCFKEPVPYIPYISVAFFLTKGVL